MKKVLLLSAGLLIGIGVSAAQDVPKAEIAFGYSFINVHPEFPQITSFKINDETQVKAQPRNAPVSKKNKKASN
jgi:hypothetical protein